MASCRRFYYRNERQIIRLTVLLLFISVSWMYFKGHFGVFKQGSRNKDGKISVVVVEEHHEALPYWINAANSGKIPKSKNTLIHIDGHSDTANPDIVENFPLFRWPQNHAEVFSLLQSNDEFIIAAIIIGLIDRFIWIVPEWSEDSQHIMHDIHFVDLGWAKVTNSSGNTNTVLCVCEYSTDDPNRRQKACYYEDETSGNETMKYTKDCSVMRTFTEETIHTPKALELLKTKSNSTSDWLKPGESIILDIDEDYFGCELPGELLYDAGMVWSDVEEFDEMLKTIFCPVSTEDEQEARIVMDKCMTILVSICTGNSERHDDSRCVESFQVIFKKIYNIFETSWKSDPELYCDESALDLKSALKQLFTVFYELSPAKLLAIQKIGFCLETTPNATYFGEVGDLLICHGANDPRNPMVQVYVPDTHAELDIRIEEIEELLDILPSPGLVTICRSVRDGYTPRSIFHKVESSLITFFQRRVQKTKVSNRYIDRNVFNIEYDANLLNGMPGLRK